MNEWKSSGVHESVFYHCGFVSPNNTFVQIFTLLLSEIFVIFSPLSIKNRYSSEEKSTLRQVVETLKQQLENAKENQLSQDKMIKNLKEVRGRTPAGLIFLSFVHELL